MNETKEYVELAKKYKELRNIVEEIVESRYGKAKSSVKGIGPKNWLKRSEKDLKNYFRKDTIKKIGIDKETLKIIGYF